MQFIDKFLNAITMYRLVLYSLIFMMVVSVIFGFLGLLPFGGFSMMASVAILSVTCFGTNFLLAKIFKVPRNTESALITALILFFIMSPIMQWSDAVLLLVVSVVSMMSKYILAIRRKHLFNPAAAGSLVLIFAGVGLSIWWAGSLIMLPFVAVSGLLIVKKLRRFPLFLSFMLTSLSFIVIFGIYKKLPPLDVFLQAFTSWPLLFFGTYMLTEPLTTPPTKRLQIIYGIVTGILFGSQFKIGPVYSTPELALILGNLFSYLVSPKLKLKLFLKEKKLIATDMYDFLFSADGGAHQTFNFKPGQYLEWTLPHLNPDNRGNRRYFTIASSPTEPEIHLGVRIQQQDASSFKKALLAMKKGDMMVASQLAGDFTLPEDTQKKIVCIAGGIGVTPFRSMIKYLIDKNQKRDIILFYACANTDGFAYQNIIEEAEKKIGLKNICFVTNNPAAPQVWKGEVGYITPELIKRNAPDFKERIFYLSGPNSMVHSYKNMLLSLKVNRKNIITDYFPGF